MRFSKLVLRYLLSIHIPGLCLDVYHIYSILALSYITKSERASWSKEYEFQFCTLVVHVSPNSLILAVWHFNGDFFSER